MGKSTSGKSRKSKSATAKVAKIKKEAGIERPTPEQAARVRFDLQPVKTEMGQVVGRAYRRQPLYRTMAKQMKISRDQVDALDFYRSAFDRSERSVTKSCLNVGVGGRVHPAVTTLQSSFTAVDRRSSSQGGIMRAAARRVARRLCEPWCSKTCPSARSRWRATVAANGTGSRWTCL